MLPRFQFAWLLGALVALASSFPHRALAQDLNSFAGSYRVSSDQTTVQIPEWGEDCGPRPASHTGASGRSVDVAVEGSQLGVQDGRRHNRTDGCWSDNPAVHRISAGGGNGHWTIVCASPQSDYQHEQGTYSVSADGQHITMHESTEYSWQLRTSRCHALASRTLVFERTGPPPTVAQPAADAGAPAHPAPPPARCATVGAPVRLQIVPGRRSLAPGGRACFRARLLDANACEVTQQPGASVAWQIARSNGAATGTDAVMENGCVRAPSASPEAEYAVSATAGAFSDRAVAAVVSADELRSLVAQHFEDEDAGTIAGPSAPVSGTGVGVTVVHEPPPPHETSNTRPLLFVALVVLALALGVGGVTLLRRKNTPERTSLLSNPPARTSEPNAVDESPSFRARREAMPIAAKELAEVAVEAAKRASLAPPSPAPPKDRPRVKKCPTCQQRFTAEMAFCPEHGTTLVDAGNEGEIAPTPAANPPPVAAASDPLPMMCPQCHKRFAATTAFCGEDGTPLVRG